MIFNRRTKDTLIVSLGSIFLLGFILSGWLPRYCPILQRHILGCPSDFVHNLPATPKEKEQARYAHQEIFSTQVIFTAKLEADRHDTAIRFAYIAQGNQVATLRVRETEGYKDLALITHPLLNNLDWSRISENGISLYQRNDTYSSIQELKLNPPPSQRIAADSAAMAKENFAVTSLENISTLDDIDYILTTYQPKQQDGNWHLFDQRFNLTQAYDNQGYLEGSIYFTNQDSTNPFLLGTIHVDYAQRP